MRIHSADELEVCEQVGKGGFGVVYRGLVKDTGQEVAIKQIDLENNDTDLLEINKEIAILSECRLPQITRYLGCFVKNYKLWVIMEFANGGSLFELLSPGPVSDEKTISIIAQEILLALEYLHNQGKIHRDLKSQNILLNTEGEVKLTDFGVSTQLSSNFSRRNTTVGTPYWMAPEVIVNNNGGHNSKADIWSLGCCCYELFTGKPPLQSQCPPMKALRYLSRCVKDEDFWRLIELEQMEVSNTFKDFLVCCFIVDPKERFSATRLLKHKFIRQVAPSQPHERQKLIKQLITNKHRWDQENHILRTQKFYLPTEMVENQQKWITDDESDAQKTVKFDISTLKIDSQSVSSQDYPSPKSSKDGSPSGTVSLADSKLNYQSLAQLDSRQRNLQKYVEPEFNKILNRVFSKLETRNSLSTEQYDLLVSLNSNMMRLLSFTESDKNNTSKILICQYLKYVIKELMKTDKGDTPRASLYKMIIPSELGREEVETIKVKPTQFDEIEKSLLETWLNEMKR